MKSKFQNKANAYYLILTFFISLIILSPLSATAQDSLYHEIFKADQAAFSAYNDRDIDAFAKYLSKDVEFYHDQDGLIFPYDTLIKAFSHLFRPDRPTQALRVLDSSSFQVYPIQGYGAVETATHKFYAVSPEKGSQFETIAKTFILWKKENDKWLMSKVVSYNHRAPNNRERIEELMSQLNIPMIGIATLKNDSIQEFIYNSGICDECPKQQPLFNVASMTKPVVTMAALALVASGDLSLDQPLYQYYVDQDIKQSQYLPRLTVEHVLRHETGFSNWRGSNRLDFAFSPGSKHQYSGEGFEYLRKVLEAKFQLNLEQLVDSLVFHPADITDAYLTVQGMADTASIVSAYDTTGTNYQLILRKEANAADDLLISPGDYAKFLKQFIRRINAKKSPFDQVLNSYHSLEGVNDIEVGLGWYIIKSGNKKVLFHSGGDKGVRSFAMLNPDNGQALVVMTSSDNGAKVWKAITEMHMPTFLPFLEKTGLE